MAETPEEFYERAKHALLMPPLDEWETFPFAGAMLPRELRPLAPEEKARYGEGGVDCRACGKTSDARTRAGCAVKSAPTARFITRHVTSGELLSARDGSASRTGDRDALGQALCSVRDYLLLVANEELEPGPRPFTEGTGAGL